MPSHEVAQHPCKVGQIACTNTRKKFCTNDVIPAYERYYKRVLDES